MIDEQGRMASGALGEYAYRSEGRSMADVVKDIIGNVQEMIRAEVRLAKTEFREEASKSISAAKLLGIGAGLGLFAAAFLLTTVALVLALFMPAWAATLVLTLALGIPAAALIAKGKSQLSVPTPQKTIDNVKENVEWIKDQTRS